MCYLYTLIFLLIGDILAGAFNELKPHFPREASEVADWFKNNFFQSSIRRHTTMLRFSHLYCFSQIHPCISACEIHSYVSPTTQKHGIEDGKIHIGNILVSIESQKYFMTSETQKTNVKIGSMSFIHALKEIKAAISL